VGLNGDDMGSCTQGVQFSKARVHGEVSATTDEYNREMCARMGRSQTILIQLLLEAKIVNKHCV
jgi:hypothetical protein